MFPASQPIRVRDGVPRRNEASQWHHIGARGRRRSRRYASPYPFLMVTTGWLSSLASAFSIDLNAWGIFGRETAGGHSLFRARSLSIFMQPNYLILRHLETSESEFLERDSRKQDVWAVNFAYFLLWLYAWIFLHLVFRLPPHGPRIDLKATSLSFTTLLFSDEGRSRRACPPISDKLTKLYGNAIGRCGTRGLLRSSDRHLPCVCQQVHSARLASHCACRRGGCSLSFSKLFLVSPLRYRSGSSGSVSGFHIWAINLVGIPYSAMLTPASISVSWTVYVFMSDWMAAMGRVAWLFVNPELTLRPASSFRFRPQKMETRPDRLSVPIRTA